MGPGRFRAIADSLVGAWIGAAWAVRMRTTLLYRVIAVLLVGIAAIRAAEHTGTINQWHLDPTARVIAGIICGAGIGVVAAVMGFAGGKLLIPATGSHHRHPDRRPPARRRPRRRAHPPAMHPADRFGLQGVGTSPAPMTAPPAKRHTGCLTAGQTPQCHCCTRSGLPPRPAPRVVPGA